MKRGRRWCLWSDRTGYHDPPIQLEWEAWRLLTRNRTLERSGDGNWATLTDTDGTIAAILIRVGTRNREQAATT